MCVLPRRALIIYTIKKKANQASFVPSMNGWLPCRFSSVSPSLSCVWSRQNLWPGKPGARALGGPTVGRPCLAPHPPASQLRLPVLGHLSSQLPISESLTCALRTNAVGCVMSLSSCLALFQVLLIILRDLWSILGGSHLAVCPFQMERAPWVSTVKACSWGF